MGRAAVVQAGFPGATKSTFNSFSKVTHQRTWVAAQPWVPVRERMEWKPVIALHTRGALWEKNYPELQNVRRAAARPLLRCVL